MILRARQLEFRFPRRPLIMGILNVTPDSFSDGGRFLDVDAAVARGLEMEAQGAEIIDVGGESTRPGATPVQEDEEQRRVLPVIERLTSRLRAAISIDTRKAGVARAALASGAAIVNDVAAHREPDELWEAVAATGAGYVCMHMQGTPVDMQRRPQYDDVVAEVEIFFEDRLARLQEAGVSRDQVVLDPGIGFGKTLEHNLKLLGGLRRLTSRQRPLLLGVSRKSFIGALLGTETDGRLPASLACACVAVGAGVSILRVHDVAETVQAVRMTGAILGCTQ